MGYYIEVASPKNKAQQLVDLYGAEILPGRPESLAQVPDGKALICIVNNGPFEAAGLCYSEREFDVFSAHDRTGPSEVEQRPGKTVYRMQSPIQELGLQRPRTWLLMDWDLACRLSGYA